MESSLELYSEAASILQKANEKKASVKTLIYSSDFKNIRQLFALVNECVKYQDVLRVVWARCPRDLRKEELLNTGQDELAVVLLYELLLGRKFGRLINLRKFFQPWKSSIQAAVDLVTQKLGVKSLREATHSSKGKSRNTLPRYMRVNLIKGSVQVVLNKLKDEGWTYVGKLDGQRFADCVHKLSPSQFGLDPVLYDVLVFPPGTDLHDHPLTQTGVLIQQDRASCVPAHVLCPSPGEVVLDCCAAPGNKTTHLASLMGDEGRVVALDRDAKRVRTLATLVSRSRARCVQVVHQDFLTVLPDSEDAEPITGVLVDPSCSGSGMSHSHGTAEDAEDPSVQARLETLKKFQITILKHALSLPNVQRVVYSTCSIHRQENEEVVSEVIGQVKGLFRLERALPQWGGGDGSSSRGLEGFKGSENFLRLSQDVDLTQGFFVACFVRVDVSSKQVETDVSVENVESANSDKRLLKKGKKPKKKRRKEPVSEESDMNDNIGAKTKKNKLNSVQEDHGSRDEKAKRKKLEKTKHESESHGLIKHSLKRKDKKVTKKRKRAAEIHKSDTNVKKEKKNDQSEET